jgi:hypothetical protein
MFDRAVRLYGHKFILFDITLRLFDYKLILNVWQTTRNNEYTQDCHIPKQENSTNKTTNRKLSWVQHITNLKKTQQ